MQGLQDGSAVGQEVAVQGIGQFFGLLCYVAFHNFLYGLLPVCLQGFGINDQGHVILTRYLAEQDANLAVSVFAYVFHECHVILLGVGWFPQALCLLLVPGLVLPRHPKTV